MGYRSDVTIVTSIEGYQYILQRISDYENICAITGEEREPFPVWYGGLHHILTVNQDKNYVILEFYSVKWYEYDFPDITVLECIFQEMRDMNIPINYCNIGEEYTDIEYRYGSFDVPDACPVRTIEVYDRDEIRESSSLDVDFLFASNCEETRLYVISLDENNQTFEEAFKEAFNLFKSKVKET